MDYNVPDLVERDEEFERWIAWYLIVLRGGVLDV